jgi:hypothetical protein
LFCCQAHDALFSYGDGGVSLVHATAYPYGLFSIKIKDFLHSVPKPLQRVSLSMTVVEEMNRYLF